MAARCKTCFRAAADVCRCGSRQPDANRQGGLARERTHRSGVEEIRAITCGDFYSRQLSSPNNENVDVTQAALRPTRPRKQESTKATPGSRPAQVGNTPFLFGSCRSERRESPPRFLVMLAKHFEVSTPDDRGGKARHEADAGPETARRSGIRRWLASGANQR